MITEQQRQERRKFIGSSDAAAILGLDSYRSAADVYLSKVYDLQEDPRPNDAILIGNVLESSIIDWFSGETGLKIKKNVRQVHANGIMAANLDGLGEEGTKPGERSNPFIVEVKTAGVVNRFSKLEDWGTPGTDAIPKNYFIQCQHQAAVMGPEYKTIHVPVLLGGVGLRHFQIDRDDEIIDALEAKEIEFWNTYVKNQIMPRHVPPNIEILKRICREPEKTVKIDSELIANWNTTKTILAEAKKREEEAKARLIAALGDAEAGETPIGMVTYFEQRRKAYQVDASTYRVLREKKPGGKNGK